jgi:hypothetical protein
MTTVLKIINGALRALQVKSSDVTLTSDELNDAMEALNMMLDGWSNESLMMYHMLSESFTLVPGQSAYTIGIGGDFNTERPISIESATIKVNGVDWPVATMAYDDWSAIRLKTLTTSFVEYLYLDNTYPLGTVNLYPVPSNAYSLTLYSRKPFTQFTSLTDPLDLPPGYARALKFGLAIEIAPEFQTTAGDDVKKLYMAAKAALKRTNKRPITSQIDPALLATNQKRFNIYKGQ